MSAAKSSAILRHVPSELLEEILLKLPIKYLLRFSTVSKSWLSMISASRFVQEQKRRSAVNGVQMMVTLPLYDLLDSDISVCRIPQTSSMGIDYSTHLICPIEGDQRRLRALCDGLWLVEAENLRFVEPERCQWLISGKYVLGETEKSLHLWNPSTGKHRKLSDSLLLTMWTRFVYGLGYDSAADDYKVLKITREKSSHIQTELYSLKSDSWKTISPPPPGIEQQGRCEYLNGSFHWIRTFSNTIVSFDLSTEKYGEIVFPAITLECKYVEVVDLVVVRGKLCVSMNGFVFALWVMEEYGVEKSWTKMLNIENRFYPIANLRLRPVYLYDNGDILFNRICEGLCMYKKETTLFKKIVDPSSKKGIGRGYIYVESMVSPLPGSRHEPSRVQI